MSAQEASKPEIESSRQTWLEAERRQRLRIVVWALGFFTFIVVAFLVWYFLLKLPSIPVECEAAIQRVEKTCKVGRKQAIKLIKGKPAVLPNDENRRETCRVLATAEHGFWRRMAMKKLFEMKRSKGSDEGAADPRQTEPLSQKTHGRKSDPMPLPTQIKTEGDLSDSAFLFIERMIIPEFIRKTYCP